MNGAQALIRTLVDSGVDTCFMNPGTSEMHFVQALDAVPEVESVLALFEGVATGAADGYGRMADRPAAVLLHLGPGLGNGLANLHNARRAGTPVLNIVGDHATFHWQYDAPLQSDIDSVARNVSGWIGTPTATADVARVAAAAVAAALGPPGQVATLVLPADLSWSEGAEPEPPAVGRAARPRWPTTPSTPPPRRCARASRPRCSSVGARCARPGSSPPGGSPAPTGAKLLCETFPARIERGAGLPAVERLGYLAEFAIAQLDGLRHLVLVDAKSPVSFFAYPEKPSDLVPDGCEVHVLATGSDDAVGALEHLADVVGADAPPAVAACRTDRTGRPAR